MNRSTQFINHAQGGVVHTIDIPHIILSGIFFRFKRSSGYWIHASLNFTVQLFTYKLGLKPNLLHITHETIETIATITILQI